MMQQGIRLAPASDCCDELCRHAGLHRPTHDTAGEQVDEGGDVEASPAVRRYLKSAIQFRFGASAANRRSRRFGEAAARSPSSFGNSRRGGRSRRAFSRMIRSMRCSPHETPSASTSRETSLAPQVRSRLALQPRVPRDRAPLDDPAASGTWTAGQECLARPSRQEQHRPT